MTKKIEKEVKKITKKDKNVVKKDVAKAKTVTKKPSKKEVIRSKSINIRVNELEYKKLKAAAKKAKMPISTWIRGQVCG